MKEINDERQTGQVIMAGKIINSKIERKLHVSRKFKEDLAEWLKTDMCYVNELVSVCKSLRKDNIVADVLQKEPDISSCHRLWRYYYKGVYGIFCYYYLFAQENRVPQEMDILIRIMFKKTKLIDLSTERIKGVLQACIQTLMVRVDEAEKKLKVPLEAVLEIIGLEDISVSEFERMEELVLSEEVRRDEEKT